MKKQKQNGYVLLLAVLISSIILAMSMGVFAISLKEVALATFARDSVRAFAAASRGLECAMFVDRINKHNAVFYGQLQDFYDPRAPIPNNVDKKSYTPFVKGNDLSLSIEPDTNLGGESWPSEPFECFTGSITASTTATGPFQGDSSFMVDFGDSCVSVEIVKDKILTTFTSNGYSDNCASTNPRRTQRTIDVSVNI